MPPEKPKSVLDEIKARGDSVLLGLRMLIEERYEMAQKTRDQLRIGRTPHYVVYDGEEDAPEER